MNKNKKTKPYYTTEKAEGRWSFSVVLLIMFFSIVLFIASWVFLWAQNTIALPALPVFETNKDELDFIEKELKILESSQINQEVLY